MVVGDERWAMIHEIRERSERIRDESRAVLARSATTVERIRRSGPRGQVKALEEEVAGLRKAMDTRAVIEQAKGVIIARTGMTADAAFAMLVRQSQHENRKVRDVAEGVVNAAIRPDGARTAAHG